jgi:DNA-binding NarL/FixJ family response regulator
VAAVAETLAEGKHLLHVHRPRVVLVDIGLPDGSGIDLILDIATADWSVDAMVISVFGDEARVMSAIRAGAQGYILKGSDVAQIGADILSMIAGGSPISPSIARHLLKQFGHEGTSATDAASSVLTQRETAILRAVARGYKRREIADQLGISEGTVGNHITSIYRKLNVASNIEAVVRATRDGMI